MWARRGCPGCTDRSWIQGSMGVMGVGVEGRVLDVQVLRTKFQLYGIGTWKRDKLSRGLCFEDIFCHPTTLLGWLAGCRYSPFPTLYVSGSSRRLSKAPADRITTALRSTPGERAGRREKRGRGGGGRVELSRQSTPYFDRRYRRDRSWGEGVVRCWAGRSSWEGRRGGGGAVWVRCVVTRLSLLTEGGK